MTTVAEDTQTKERVEAVIDKWLEPLGLLMGWTIHWNWNYTDDVKLKNGSHCLATCSTDWQYLRATVTFNLPALASYHGDQLEHVVVHELMHIHLAELRSKKPKREERNHEERVATMLAKAFAWTWQRAESDGIRNGHEDKYGFGAAKAARAAEEQAEEAA